MHASGFALIFPVVAPAENKITLPVESALAGNAAPTSRRRSLLRDLAAALGLQMRYWGMDARGGSPD